MPIKNKWATMCKVINTKGMSNQWARDAQVMAAKANKKADIYTTKEVSKAKAKKAKKSRMK